MDKYLIANINMFSLNNQVFLVDDFTREPCQIGTYSLADLPQALVQIAYDNNVNVVVHNCVVFNLLIELLFILLSLLMYNNYV